MGYKFFEERNESEMISTMENMDYSIKELSKCLESENVLLSTNDIVRLIDIFIRINNKPNMDMYSGLNFFISINTEYKDSVYSDKAYTKFPIELFGIIKNMCDITSCNFDDLDSIEKNILIIFHEICIFVNDLINKMRSMMNSMSRYSSYIHIVKSICISNDENSTINFELINANFDRNKYVIRITSNVFGDMNYDTIYSMDTFKIEDKNAIKEFNKNKKV